MNQTSSIITGGLTISAATVQPAVSWALGAIFHAPVPESVSVLVTGLICAAAHAAANFLIARTGGGVSQTVLPVASQSGQQ